MLLRGISFFYGLLLAVSGTLAASSEHSHVLQLAFVPGLVLGPLISSSKPAAKCTFSAIAHPTPLLRSANAGLLPLSVNHRVRGLVGLNAAVDESEELVDKRTEGQEAMIQRLSNIADANERQAALKEVYHLIHNDAMQELARNLQAGSENAAAWQALLLDIQALTESRMEQGKDVLMELLASGEINILDRKITQMVRSGDIDPAFVAVLNLNIDDAQAKQEENNRLAVLGHIYTRVQEELEKRAKPAVGLLHKLMRLADQPGIRANLLEHNLKPTAEEEREMILDPAGSLVFSSGALVEPMELVAAIKQYMEQIQGLMQVQGSQIDEVVAGQALEDCRIIAKEARQTIEVLYDEETLNEFTEALTPVFQPIMQTLAQYRRDDAQ